MYQFEKHLTLLGFDTKISDCDRQLYFKEYEVIRDQIFLSICQIDEDFRDLFNGTSLFGSQSTKVPINIPDEFDAIINLKIPFSSLVEMELDDERPGFIYINLKDVMDKMSEDETYDSLYDLLDDLTNDYFYLDRSCLKYWISKLFCAGLENLDYRVLGCNRDVYFLEYSTRGLTHTIYAHCDNRKILIDFVPGIMFQKQSWMKLNSFKSYITRNKTWYAVPKPSFGNKRTKYCSFLICNPHGENKLLHDRQHLKVTFCLLKALCRCYKMKRFKTYFLTTAFFWEITKNKPSFWENSLSDLLIHMLNVLDDYFQDGVLPFFWNKDLNLLDILRASEIKKYAKLIRSAYNTLSTYPSQPLLSFERTLTHFDFEERF
ncbi:uncharacterized protein LOC119681278 [Teleopsis dalmanni]|uniref:uncharacterized protein LOC119679490 n=1 Tax=Teleopsis dalmanni TaxID=139649 RepID=UPI0018CD7109|nr:uncharacterized protein LOC119679490 [Teleopsis dalmanni]XP_037947801.1 uncharacterized protein LOC119679490 [Teleopsis dalmanni]XP_037950354.1 uncharacterized protein LOC119681278 [Teleopsis dalmanni]